MKNRYVWARVCRMLFVLWAPIVCICAFVFVLLYRNGEPLQWYQMVILSIEAAAGICGLTILLTEFNRKKER